MVSDVSLQPEDGTDPIEIPNEKTTIGRGPFMKVTDKRVSRKHAILELNANGKLVVTPIHANPCFLLPAAGGEKLTLAKDKPRVLQHGEELGLLPDSLFFKVIYSHPDKNRKNSPTKQEKSQVADGSEEESDETPEMNGKAGKKPQKDSKAGTAKPRGRDMAMPIERNRVLPKWMVGASKRVDVQSPKKEDKPANQQPKIASNAQTPKKKTARAELSDEEEEAPRKKPARGKPKARKRVEDEDEDWEEEEVTPRARGSSHRSRRAVDDSDDDDQPRERRTSAQNRPTYTGDNLDISDLEVSDSQEDVEGKKKEDSDYIADDLESGSDWDASVSKKGKRGKIKTTPSPGKRKRSRRKSSASASMDHDLSEDDEAYVPRPSKRRGTPVKKKTAVSSDDEEEEEEEEKKPEKTKKRKADSDEEIDKTSKRKRKRKSCMFGKKCYRKNPKHFEGFCHPGDSSFEEEEEEEATIAGLHVPRQPKREKDKRSILHGGSDDDGEANTYDYNDSFLAAEDDDSNSSSSFDAGDTDSDWDPEEEDNVKSLMKEAKGFIRNKKMVKPARTKY